MHRGQHKREGEPVPARSGGRLARACSRRLSIAYRPRCPWAYAGLVANEALVQSIKDIVALAKEGDLDGSYDGYRDLFASAAFGTYRVEDQRQALRLMIARKGAPQTP